MRIFFLASIFITALFCFGFRATFADVNPCDLRDFTVLELPRDVLEAVKFVCENGIMSAQGLYSLFDGDRTVNRYEIASIIARFDRLILASPLGSTIESTERARVKQTIETGIQVAQVYLDIPGDHWALNDVNYLTDARILQGRQKDLDGPASRYFGKWVLEESDFEAILNRMCARYGIAKPYSTVDPSQRGVAPTRMAIAVRLKRLWDEAFAHVEKSETRVDEAE